MVLTWPRPPARAWGSGSRVEREPLVVLRRSSTGQQTVPDTPPP